MTRVAVTTDQYDDVAVSYVDAGLEPVSLPCIQVRPAPAEEIELARERTALADVIVITSPRVVSLLWPEGDMPPVKTAVVGASTAAAVTRAGGLVDLVGDGGLARLVDLTSNRLDDGRVVIVHAVGSDAAAMNRLRELAHGLEEYAVYLSAPVAPDLAPVDAVAFASPSAVTGWSLSRGLDDVVVGAIGTTTARAVARYREPDVVAERTSHTVLAQAIAAFMEVKV